MKNRIRRVAPLRAKGKVLGLGLSFQVRSYVKDCPFGREQMNEYLFCKLMGVWKETHSQKEKKREMLFDLNRLMWPGRMLKQLSYEWRKDHENRFSIHDRVAPLFFGVGRKDHLSLMTTYSLPFPWWKRLHRWDHPPICSSQRRRKNKDRLSNYWWTYFVRLGNGFRLQRKCHWVRRRLDFRFLDLLGRFRYNRSQIGFKLAKFLKLNLSGEHLFDAIRQTLSLGVRVKICHLLNVSVKKNNQRVDKTLGEC